MIPRGGVFGRFFRERFDQVIVKPLGLVDEILVGVVIDGTVEIDDLRDARGRVKHRVVGRGLDLNAVPDGTRALDGSSDEVVEVRCQHCGERTLGHKTDQSLVPDARL